MPKLKQGIEIARPPNFGLIVARFPNAANHGVYFSYGYTLYNPSGVTVTRELREHEATHGERQLAMGVEAWWNRYLTDRLFVLDEELHAHHAEWRASVKRHGPDNRRLRMIAAKLAGPLYGCMISAEQAAHAIVTGVVQ